MHACEYACGEGSLNKSSYSPSWIGSRSSRWRCWIPLYVCICIALRESVCWCKCMLRCMLAQCLANHACVYACREGSLNKPSYSPSWIGSRSSCWRSWIPLYVCICTLRAFEAKCSTRKKSRRRKGAPLVGVGMM